MRRADAPRAGWYPDPTGGSQLRWWDGLDWTDHRRAPPVSDSSELLQQAAAAAQTAVSDPSGPTTNVPSRRSTSRTRDETAEIMAEVRRVAREEVDRAVDRVSNTARDATRRIEPLITQYGDRVMEWIRNLGIIAIVLVILWMLMQTFAQASLMDWIGDRVDNLTGTIAPLLPGDPGPPR